MIIAAMPMLSWVFAIRPAAMEGVIRQEQAGASIWTTFLGPGGNPGGIGSAHTWMAAANDGAGNVFLGDFDGNVFEMVAGSNQWTQLSSLSARVLALAVDGSNTLWAVTPEPWAVSKLTSGSSTWETVDTYGTQYSVPTSIATYAGNIYVGGSSSTALANPVSVVRGSSDGGNHWSILDTVPDASVYQIAVDSNGNIFAMGNDLTASNSVGKLLRVSEDGGSFWSSVGVGPFTNSGAAWSPVAIDGQNNVFIASLSDTGWTTLESSDQGNTWTNVDSAPNSVAGAPTWPADANSGYGWEPFAIGISPTGTIYVGGTYFVPGGTTGMEGWYVRQSSNGGVTWATSESLPITGF